MNWKSKTRTNTDHVPAEELLSSHHSFILYKPDPACHLIIISQFIYSICLFKKWLMAETPVKNSSKSPCCLTSGRRWTPAVANKLNLLFLFFFSPASISVLQKFTARRWQCDRIVCLCLLERWGDGSLAFIQTYDAMATWREQRSQKTCSEHKTSHGCREVGVGMNIMEVHTLPECQKKVIH